MDVSITTPSVWWECEMRWEKKVVREWGKGKEEEENRCGEWAAAPLCLATEQDGGGRCGSGVVFERPSM